MMPLVLFIGCFAFAASDPTPAGQEKQIVEKIVAVVGGDIILHSEVEGVLDDMVRAAGPTYGGDLQSLRQNKRREIIDTLIAEKILEQEIHKLHIEVSDQELERAIQDMVSKNGINMEHLEAALKKQGLTLEEYRAGMKKQLLKAKIIQLKVRSKVQVTDQDVKSTYATRTAQSSQNFKVRAQHILFLVKDEKSEEASRRLAEKALARIRAGEDFGKVAEEMSEGPSRARKGELGEFGKGEMMPAFEDAAFSAEIGRPIGPVRTSIGWHIILVNDHITSVQKPIEEIGMRIRQDLYEKEVERAFGRYIEELKGKVYIEIRDSAS